MSVVNSADHDASVLDSELYFLISRFLDLGPCKKASQALKEEIERHQLLPKRIDWQGQQHARSFQSLLDTNKHISADHLRRICQRIGPLLEKEVKASVPGVQSLLGAGRQSLLRTSEGSKNTRWPIQTHSVLQNGLPKFPPLNLHPVPSLAHVTSCRQLTGSFYQPHAIQCKSMFSNISMQSRILGHLSAVYCVTFDRTGLYIFTGADDHLVKVWSVLDGRLLATLRGHSAEITDMAVNHENTLLASGGCDKVVRVWCLKTCGTVAVLTGHTGVVTSVQFCPLVRGDSRYLVSTGGDGCVCFWHWTAPTRIFDPKPNKFLERSRAGAQMLCSSCSAGGVFLATGSTDHVIRVYCFLSTVPEKICELEAHTDKVDSIAYSNHGDRFVSGSKDGTARIWRYDHQEWKAILLNMNTKVSSSEVAPPSDMRPVKPRVTMVGWSTNDSYVVTAVSDHSLKVWNSHNGALCHVLEGHDDEVYVLDTNSLDERILLSAAHDGNVIIWDIEKGVLIKSFFNMIEGQGHGSIFDCKFSRDGQSIVATDSHGHLLIFGFGSSERYEKVPKENFFHTDYRPLIRDANNYVLDEQTQQPPHLMPPPFLVDVDGNPHPPHYQRLVPGRENCSQEQLVPQMVETASGDREVADEQVEPVVQGDGEDDQRPRNLDEAIQRMQQMQNLRLHEEEVVAAPPEVQQMRSPGPARRRSRSESVQSPTHGRVGMRWNGEVEGVRQPAGNIVSQAATNTELQARKLRTVVRELDKHVFRKNSEWRQSIAEEEVKHYFAETKKKPLDYSELDSDSGSYIATRKRSSKKISHNYRTRATRNDNEQTTRNRLATRALYDTEEEEEEDVSGVDTSGEISELETWNNNEIGDSESSEFSDWAADAGMNLQPPKRSARGPKKKVPHSPEGGTDTSQKRKPQQRKGKQNKRLMNSGETITELPDEFRPPEWLTDIIPRKAPYVPQMGDEVIYFRQGHEQYVHAVKLHNVYDINPNRNQPWHKLTNLREQELVKVIGIKYEIKPPRLCCVKLGFLDPGTGKLTGSYFSIKYHDMPDVIDFLVLKQNYDLAMERNWNPGDRFRSMIDDAWWIGKIDSQEPFQLFYPDSMYQCFNVQWDNGEGEKLSPWDMEPIVARRVPREVGGSVPVTQDELKSLMYSPTTNEWPSGDRDSECLRIVQCIEQLMEYRIAEPFLTPVDLTAFPIYAMVIEYPIDLSTIKGRLENHFYRRVTALQFDVRHISSNTEKFNQASAPIVKWAHIITDILLRFISEPELTDVHAAYVEASDGMEVDEEDKGPSTSQQRERRSRNESSSDSAISWREHCEELLKTVVECDDSLPFRNPVDQIDFPDYYEVIGSPMDLTTVKEELDAGNYKTPQEFSKDMQLIFTNSRTYNTNKRSRIYTMTLRLKALFDDHMRTILEDYKSASKRRSKQKQSKSSSRATTSSSAASFYNLSTRRRPPKPQLRASAVSSPSKSKTQPSSSRSSRSQANTSGSLRLTLRNVSKRRHESTTDESSDEDVNNGSVRRSGRSKGKPSTSNGHGSYTTRHKTGAIKRRRYHEFGVTSADDDDVDDDDDDDDGDDGANNAENGEDSDHDSEATEIDVTEGSENKDVPSTNGHTSLVNRPRRAAASKKTNLKESSDEESGTTSSQQKSGRKSAPGGGDEDMTGDDEDDSESGGDDSGSDSSDSKDSDDNSDDSENEEEEEVVRRSRRMTTQNSTKASQSVTTRGAGKRTIARNQQFNEDFVDETPRQTRTRNAGKKTVEYAESNEELSDEEEADVKVSSAVRSSRRMGRRVQYREDSNYEDDDDEDDDYKVTSRPKRRKQLESSEDEEAREEAVVSRSSRGRLRRMTPRARESLLAK